MVGVHGRGQICRDAFFDGCTRHVLVACLVDHVFRSSGGCLGDLAFWQVVVCLV